MIACISAVFSVCYSGSVRVILPGVARIPTLNCHVLSTENGNELALPSMCCTWWPSNLDRAPSWQGFSSGSHHGNYLTGLLMSNFSH